MEISFLIFTSTAICHLDFFVLPYWVFVVGKQVHICIDSYTGIATSDMVEDG